MPRTEKLRLEYVYRPNLVKGLEDASKVLIMAYLSADLGHGYCLRVANTMNNTLELEIRVPDNAPAQFIPAGAGVTFRLGAAGFNDQGTKTIRQVGSTFIGIRELLVNRKTELAARPLIVPNLENPRTGTVPQKGTLSVIVHPTSLSNAVLPVSKYDFVPENYPEFERVLMQNMERAARPHLELRSTFKNAVGLKMPPWRSGHMVVPGALFAVPRAKPASEEWWTNCLIAATRRAYPHLRSEAETYEFLERRQLDETERMHILMLAHTAVVAAGTCYVSDGVYVKKGDDLPVQSQPNAMRMSKLIEAYPPTIKSCINVSERLQLAESVEFRGMEDFAVGWARVMKNTDWGCYGSIDCEDGGADICLQAHDFMTAQFQSGLLKYFHAAAKNYDAAQLLKYVNGAQLSDSTRNNPLGGHMDAAYMSKSYEVRMQENGSVARPVFQGFDARADSVTPKDHVQNPVIIGEGTGLMMPLADDRKAAELTKNMRYLGLHTNARYAEAMRGVRYMMPHAKTKPSQFYNTVLSICPLRIADNYPVIEHIMTKSLPGQKPTIGVDYLEFLNGGSNNSAFLAGQMTEEEIPYMQELLKHHFPIPAYEAAPAPMSSTQPLLERLVRTTAQQARPERPGAEHFQLFFNQHDVREESVQTIMQRIEECSRVCRARYHFENWGKDLGTWCLTLHLNV